MTSRVRGYDVTMHPALQAAMEVLEASADKHALARTMTYEACQSYARYANSWRTSDPYHRAQVAADEWRRAYWPPRNEAELRTLLWLRFGGHKGLAGGAVRAWRTRLKYPHARVASRYEAGYGDADNAERFCCPYRYSQHGGASRGGGTWSAQWYKAWELGEAAARAHLTDG